MFLPSDITLQFGDSGDFVAEMQRRLVAVQGGSNNLVTGHFDGMTVNAVSSFQSRVGLRADGIAGPDTLRRLNGVYSGEPITSSDSNNDTKQEEEEAAVATQFQREALLAADAVAQSSQPHYAEEKATARAVVDVTTEHVAPLEPQPATNAPQTQMQQQILRDAALQTSPAPNPSDLLAQMLLDQPRPAPSAPDSNANIPLDARPPLGASRDASPANALVTSTSQEILPPEQARRETTLTREQAPSLIQRGVQMANAMLQKIADYFEATLPNSVLKEVQEAGRVMAQNGVKEVAIPTGPETPTRGAETPARGAEQAQIQQRG